MSGASETTWESNALARREALPDRLINKKGP
jgi:hypothetical protein